MYILRCKSDTVKPWKRRPSLGPNDLCYIIIIIMGDLILRFSYISKPITNVQTTEINYMEQNNNSM